MRIFLVTICLFPLTALANFTGHWTAGDAQLTVKNGDVYICEETTIDVDQQKDKVQFGKFTYSCGGVAFIFTPPVMQLEGQTVHYKNKYNDNVGTFTDTEANLIFVINEQNGRDKYTVKKVSDTELDYLYQQLDVDPKTKADVITRSIHANLKKVN